ncbi:hypothetical protein MD484_g692, partial [Candolleomyces efflorescens]
MDSPFSERLDTGYSPSDAEMHLIKALIQEKVHAIDMIDTETKGLEESLAALKARRKAHKIFITKHRALIAPIKQLPPDILQTVFLACLPAIGRPQASMTCDHPAVVISHVCRHWRQLAFETPLLWSRIQLVFPYVNCDPYYPPYHPANDEPDVNGEVASLFDAVVQRLFDITTVWLARSKSCPLSICMEASEGAGGGFVSSRLKPLEGSILTSLERLVGLLLSQSKRWEQIRFKLATDGHNSASQLSRLLCLDPQDVPILRKASIVINPLDSVLDTPISPSIGSEPTPNFWDGFRMGTIHGDALQSLTLACPKAATKSKVLEVNWAGLTELSLRPYMWSPTGRRGGAHLPAEEALTLLRLCPNLRRCNLAIGNGTVPWGTPPHVWDPRPTPVLSAQDDRPLCRLPHLYSLILREDSRTDSLASALDLPSLRFFTQNSSIFWPRPPVSAEGYESYYASEEEKLWNDIPLVGWVQRFGHTITTIDFKHVGVPQHAVEKCLEELPNLISLTIRSPFSESWSSNLPWGVASGCDSFLQRLTPQVFEDGETAHHRCLCPKLEDLVLNSVLDSVPVQLVFSEAGVLELLTGRAKASLKTVPEVSRVSKLRYLNVGFVKPKVVDIEEELSRRGFDLEGFIGEWNYPAPPRPRSYLQTPLISDSMLDEFLVSSSYV